MKLYYIAPLASVRELQCQCHYIDLPDGHVLVGVHWRDEAEEKAWSERPEVKTLPHPIFEAATELSDEHHAHLSGHPAIKLKKGHNIHDLIKQAGAIHPLLRLRVL